MPRITVTFTDEEHAALKLQMAQLKTSTLSDTVRQLVMADHSHGVNAQLEAVFAMLENIHQAVGEVKSDIGIKTAKAALAALYTFGLLIGDKGGVDGVKAAEAKAIAIEEIRKLK